MLTKKDSLKSEVKTSKSQKEKADNIQQSAKQPPAPPQTPPQQKPSTSYMPNQPKQSTTAEKTISEKKGSQTTRITVKYNVGYGNILYIRGKGANLSWEKGIPLKNIKADEWQWETDKEFSQCEFKVLINDKTYENGENHYLRHSASITYVPHFYHKS